MMVTKLLNEIKMKTRFFPFNENHFPDFFNKEEQNLHEVQNLLNNSTKKLVCQLHLILNQESHKRINA